MNFQYVHLTLLLFVLLGIRAASLLSAALQLIGGDGGDEAHLALGKKLLAHNLIYEGNKSLHICGEFLLETLSSQSSVGLHGAASAAGSAYEECCNL